AAGGRSMTIEAPATASSARFSAAAFLRWRSRRPRPGHVGTCSIKGHISPKRKAKHGAAAGIVGHRDSPRVRLHDFTGDRKTEPSALARPRIPAPEPLEQVLAIS